MKLSRTLATALLGGALFLSSSAFAADTWSVDPAHSTAIFRVKHFGASWQYGRFNDISGTLVLDDADPSKSTIELTIKTDSVDTNNQKRDDHLKSPDFFNAAQYPTMTFKSTSVEVTGKESAKLYGDLTIRGVSKPAVLAVEFQGSAKSPWGTTNYGFNGTTKINREDWGLNWNAALESGGWLVGKEVQIDIELELVQVAEPAATAAA